MPQDIKPTDPVKLIKKAKTVPLPVWAAAGLAFLAIWLFAHRLPSESDVKELEFFNVGRLERFAASSEPHHLRVVAVGDSHTLCSLFFDERMNELARKNGLPELQFVRFVKLNGNVYNFLPLLDPILKARPDIVLLQSNLFALDFNVGFMFRGKLVRFPGMAPAAADDDRKKLVEFAQVLVFGKKYAPRIKINPNAVETEEEAFHNVGNRQSEADFDRMRAEGVGKLSIRDVSAPPAYAAFFQKLNRLGIPCVLLDIPASKQALEAYPREVREAMPGVMTRYCELYGLRYLEFPQQLSLDYYKDFVHLNAAGREVYSRWLLAELPKLVGKDKTL